MSIRLKAQPLRWATSPVGPCMSFDRSSFNADVAMNTCEFAIMELSLFDSRFRFSSTLISPIFLKCVDPSENVTEHACRDVSTGTRFFLLIRDSMESFAERALSFFRLRQH